MTEPRTPENPQDEALVPAAAVPTRTRFAAPPAAAEPLPAEPAEPLPTEPAEPLPAEPLPAEPVPTAPVPAEPVPTEPADPVPAEPAPDLTAPAAPLPPAGVQDAGDQAAVPAVGQGRGLVLALTALVVVLAALTGFLGVAAKSTAGPPVSDTARHDALAAARSAARVIFSYDYRHLDKDFAAGRAVSTGTFRSEYEKTTTKLVGDVAPRYKAVVVADVSDAGVVSGSEDRVLALVFVNQQSTSSLMATAKITQSRLEMTLVRSGDTWLVEKIKAL